MIDFLLHSANLPFSIALGVMIGIGLLEGISALLGAGLSSLLDSILPDFDFDVDMEADADAIGSAGALSRIFGWLHVGRVPVLVLFVFFLCGFGTGGLVIQSVASSALGVLLPGWLASLPAAFAALSGVRLFGRLFIRWFPGDETQAVSEDSFVGRIAVVTLGTARVGGPAQAKFRDEHGQIHYAMIEPEDAGVEFPAGEEVLLVARKGHVFLAVSNPTGVSFQDLEPS